MELNRSFQRLLEIANLATGNERFDQLADLVRPTVRIDDWSHLQPPVPGEIVHGIHTQGTPPASNFGTVTYYPPPGGAIVRSISNPSTNDYAVATTTGIVGLTGGSVSAFQEFNPSGAARGTFGWGHTTTDFNGLSVDGGMPFPAAPFYLEEGRVLVVQMVASATSASLQVVVQEFPA